MAKLVGEARIDELCKQLSEKYGFNVSKDVYDPEDGADETERAEDEKPEPAAHEPEPEHEN